MEELIFKPEEHTGHPNYELEEDLKSIEMLIEMSNNKDDLKKIYILKDKIYSKKFDAGDMILFTQLKDIYLKKPD